MSVHLGSAGVNEECRPQGDKLIDAGDRDASLGKVPATGRDLVNQVAPTSARSRLRAAYADFLERYEWQWLATLTFQDNVHPEAARKKYGRWIDWVNRRAHGRRYRRWTKGVYWALATELQKRGVIHFHALLADAEDLNLRVSRKDARNRWYEIEGIARIDPITHGLGAVTNYVSKYVVKGGDLELSESLKNYRSQQQMDVSR